VHEVERITQARIRRARETLVAVDRFLREQSADSVAAVHELHARHLLELGDPEGAAQAQERAVHARMAWAPIRPAPSGGALDELP